MTSKTLRSITLLLTLAAMGLAFGGCDDKSKDSEASDVANLADSSRSQSQGQQEAGEDGETDRERASASSPGGATVAKEAPLDASLYLLQSDIPRLERAPTETSALVGKQASPTYATVRIHPKSNDSYGAALQLWKVEDQDAAEELVQRMREQYLGVKSAPKNAPVGRQRAFLSSRAGITTYVFAAGKGSPFHVAAISCGQQACPKGWSDVRRIAGQVFERIENPNAVEELEEQRRELDEKGASRAEELREERKERQKRKEEAEEEEQRAD